MKVLVDTSVWVDFFNGHPGREANTLARLIDEEVEVVTCGVIAAEFLQGVRTPNTLSRLEFHFRDMQWLPPQEPETYLAAATLFRNLRSIGITIRSTIDCLVAQLASENNAFLLYKDRDLAMIINSGLISVRSIPLS